MQIPAAHCADNNTPVAVAHSRPLSIRSHALCCGEIDERANRPHKVGCRTPWIAASVPAHPKNRGCCCCYACALVITLAAFARC